MFQPINHRPALSVAVLLMLALFTQLLAPASGGGDCEHRED